ncbi:molybdopterin-binding domain of aldehyde dehydrogenase family protein [Paraburkholderia xenovorans LB400]|uniref:Xanthine dehydrogenase, molybdenum binding subunit apoprotein n=1 Tax=Paraburkholderia xenovorans (strain LB400) TaxID=266265 RepID=Q13J85_PARXL|nr:xanthine dehydrogenase family protein molybdopterin-binding subunit [Paraburkholderia xenovorans]ABE35854.1 xanthine dehydrogenase, molybdenum binding subunit apoprotein [Paraburkholderia xenovorans LB400]AIP37037.1 molybdopterin-binding domain of aldehyde dehydrogenase family protein [Paraburkholderia xenovorans LB400]
MSEDFRYLNKPVRRTEDYRLLTGYGRYIDDIELSGALHACFVRSPHAHARIMAINSADARAMPGVAAIVTGRDLLQWTNPLHMAPPIEGLLPVEIETMPTDTVRFQGDIVACVVAVDRYLAEDAAERVLVEYEALPAVTDMWQSLEPDAPQVDPMVPGNRVSHQTFTHGNPDAVSARAYRVVEATFNQQRQTHVPIETRGCAAQWDVGRQHLTFHIGTQIPHPLRTNLAGRLGLSESQVTVVSPDVGGSFGQKIALYREELVVAALARQLRRPVRWREDRLENLSAAANSREDFCRTRAAVDKYGTLLALTLEMREDFGAYCFFPANYLARVVAMVLSGPYRLDHYAFDVQIVLSNKCGNAPMRAPMSITSWVMEGTLEAVARELRLDPVEVRRRNMLRADELPYTTPTGEVIADVTPVETFEGVLAAIDYADFRARQREALAHGRHLGLGLCNVVEPTTYGSRFYKAAGIPGSGHEACWIRIEPTGIVNASVGLGPTGQGYETAMANAVAEGLGVAPSRVRVLLGNTDIAPYGMGTRGARSATAGGGALYLCARDARDKVLAIAAARLCVPSDTVRLIDGCVERREGDGWFDAGVDLNDVARQAYMDPTSLPPGLLPGLEFHRTYDPPAMTYSNSAHACEIELDVATGAIQILRYVIAEDCGTLLNPTVVEGQQHGAIVMGLSGALFEEVIYDEAGQITTGSLADYMIATAPELPHLELIPMHTPNRTTAAGIKGMAEGGVMGALGAITNALNDALSPWGVVAERHPLTPMMVRDLLRDKP